MFGIRQTNHNILAEADELGNIAPRRILRDVKNWLDVLEINNPQSMGEAKGSMLTYYNMMVGLLDQSDNTSIDKVVSDIDFGMENRGFAQSITLNQLYGFDKATLKGMIKDTITITDGLKKFFDNDMIKERIEEMAKDYDDPDEFVRYYMGNQELLSGVQTLVMEDKVVDWIAEQAKVIATSSSFDEVMKPQDG